MNLFNKENLNKAKTLIDDWFINDDVISQIEDYLKNSIDLKFQKKLDNAEDEKVRTMQNQFIQFLLQYIDANPLAVRDGHTSELRSLVWKYSGINCDDFSKLDIRANVRFDNPQGGDLKYFNPDNITILTGGNKCLITGLRNTTYLDGTGKVIIYGSFNCASGVNIFTHDHEFQAPDKPLFNQGRTNTVTIIYPECFIGEGAFIFGNLNTRNVVAPKTVTRLNKVQAPLAIIGGIGSSFGTKKQIDAGTEYPPAYLKETIKNVKQYSKIYGDHLEKYVEIVARFLKTDRQDWNSYQAEINILEKVLLENIG